MMVFLEQIVLILIVALIPCSFSRNLVKRDVSCQELSVDKNNYYAIQNSDSTFRLKEEQDYHLTGNSQIFFMAKLAVITRTILLFKAA